MHLVALLVKLIAVQHVLVDVAVLALELAKVVLIHAILAVKMGV